MNLFPAIRDRLCCLWSHSFLYRASVRAIEHEGRMHSSGSEEHQTEKKTECPLTRRTHQHDAVTTQSFDMRKCVYERRFHGVRNFVTANINTPDQELAEPRLRLTERISI